MPQEKIANRQLYFMLFLIRCNVAVALLPVLTTANALQDAWISAIVQFFPALLLLLFFGSLGQRFVGLTVAQYSEKLLGRWAGKGVALVIAWAFLHMAAVEVRAYADMLITAFLPDTPLVFLIGAMVIASATAAHAGIEVIARAADLLFPVYLLMIISSLLIPLPQLQGFLVNLEPVLARGAGPVLRGAATPALFTVQYLVLTVLAPTVNEPKRALRTAIWALVGATVILIPVAVITVAILGPQLGTRAAFPFFSMVRVIAISEFFERIEALAVFAWGLGLFIELAVYLYCGGRALSQILGMPDYRPLILPMAVIWTAFGSHVTRNMFQLMDFFKPHFFVPYALALVVVPFGLLWMAYLLRRLLRGRSGAS
jgi:spore germination protein KB